MSLDYCHCSIEQDEQSAQADHHEVVARIERFESLPKTRPPYASLRECLLATLSCKDMDAITSKPTTSHVHRNAIEKALRFDLFRAYKNELKVDANTTQAQHYFWQAVGSTDQEHRQACRAAIVFLAIRKRLQDASLLAQREALEIDESCLSSTSATHTATRL